MSTAPPWRWSLQHRRHSSSIPHSSPGRRMRCAHSCFYRLLPHHCGEVDGIWIRIILQSPFSEANMCKDVTRIRFAPVGLFASLVLLNIPSSFFLPTTQFLIQMFPPVFSIFKLQSFWRSSTDIRLRFTMSFMLSRRWLNGPFFSVMLFKSDGAFLKRRDFRLKKFIFFFVAAHLKENVQLHTSIVILSFFLSSERWCNQNTRKPGDIYRRVLFWIWASSRFNLPDQGGVSDPLTFGIR